MFEQHNKHKMSFYDRDGITNYSLDNKDILQDQRQGNNRSFMNINEDQLADKFSDEIKRNHKKKQIEK